MADSNNVYWRVTDWNGQIIQPINDLVTHPPDGCDPLEPLSEAEKNHLWMKQDVIDVQNKLKELCPDNDFTSLDTPQLATVILIQEIESAILVGWCAECDDEQELNEWSLGIWTCQKESGTGYINQCCNIEIEVKGALSVYTGWDVYKYTSPYYNAMQYSVSNGQNWTIVQEQYQLAREASTQWAKQRGIELLQQYIVEQKAEELKDKQETLDILLLQLAACTANCDTIQTQIDQIEQEISVLENEITEAKQKRDEAKQEAVNYLAAADAAATANWEALKAFKSFDPQAINVVADLISDISSAWGLDKYPFDYNISTWGVGYTKWYTFAPTTPITGFVIGGLFTHSGLPYSKNSPMIWGSDWYRQWQKKHCCGLWEMNQGLCIVGECSDWVNWESNSDLPSTNTEGNKLELKIGIVQGTEPAEDYDPDP